MAKRISKNGVFHTNGTHATPSTPPAARTAANQKPFRVIGPTAEHPGEATAYVGDCREVVPQVVAPKSVDLIFADPPFNWKRGYDEWDDDLPRAEYMQFTRDWLNACADALADNGSFWVNIPDDSAADIVVHLRDHCKLHLINWCVWHYRFGQNTTQKFINSKVHALYFARHREVLNPAPPKRMRLAKPGGPGRTWNPAEILEISDRRAIYGDPRTESKKDGIDAGHRVPMDVWYGQYWGRIQGNNAERRGYHDNQLPEVYLERVIRACSNPGDLVMDPFLGSGTTGVVARALGRNFVGVEYSKANAQSACERIAAGPVRVGKVQTKGVSTAIFENRRKKAGVGREA